MTDLLADGTTWLLVLAHPGHELRAFHLLERVKPIVTVLTDGSGSTGISRVAESSAVLTSVGARRGPMFGALTDRESYRALLEHDAAPFVSQVQHLAHLMCEEGVTTALVDAAEGYNPVHDVCHWMARAAVARARALGTVVELFELDLISHPDGIGNGVRLALDDEAFGRKLEALGRYHGLAGEAAAAFERHGKDAFRIEFLRKVLVDQPLPASQWVPHYEEVGAARVKAGTYASILTYAAHVKPIIETLLARDLRCGKPSYC
jgi:hypothetical protein